MIINEKNVAINVEMWFKVYMRLEEGNGES